MDSTQTITKKDIYSQAQEIILLGFTWDELTKEQKTLFANPLLLASLGVSSNLEAFNYLTTNPNALFTSSKELNATVDAALTENLLEVHQDYLNQELNTSPSNYSINEQELIKKLVAIRVEEIRLEKLLENQELQNKIKPEVDKLDTKQNPRQDLVRTANQAIQSAGKKLTPAQKTVALKKLVAICLTSNLDFKNPKELNLATSIALNENKLYQEVSKAVSSTTNQEYSNAIQNPNPTKIINSQADITTDTSKLSSLTQIKTPHSIQVNPNNNDLGDTLDTEINKLHQIENNPAALKISHTLLNQVSDTQLNQITHTINNIDPTILRMPTQAGEKAAAVVEQNPASTTLTPQAIILKSQGLTSTTWAKIYQNAEIQKLVSPQQAHSLSQQLRRQDQSSLGKEIFEPLGKAGRAFQTLTNQLGGKLPQKIATPLNYALHPVQSIKGYLGKQAGKYLGKKIYKAFAKKVTNKTARLVAKTLLREGVKKGVVTLLKLGLRGAIGAAEVALGATGIGALVVVVLEVGAFAIKKLVQGVQKIAESLWGEKIKARDLLALPALAIAGVGSTLASLATVTVAAASSAGGIIAASSVAGIFVYVAALTVAPLISTIAHLEMQPTFQGIGIPGDPDYIPPVPTGPIPPGCPSGWPTHTGYITQGPHTSSTHYGAEAIDIGVGMGTPIYSTHPGRAVAGRHSAYGNYVDVYGVCAGISFATRYAHMPVMPFSGEKVVASGEQIGVVNNTGNSTGSHLHYDIRGGALGDINRFLPKPVMRGCIEYSNCQVDIP